jgi:DNA polymerase-3 subunit delta'
VVAADQPPEQVLAAVQARLLTVVRPVPLPAGASCRARCRAGPDRAVSVFADLVGQERVVEQLEAAAADAARVVAGAGGGPQPRAGGMTHAWLFTGPPGSGRSVAARAFAAALQCETAGQPGCGHCSGCVQSLSGAHPDVALIVPEGLHLTISDARDIIVRSSRAPTRGRWQITLIEDADRMEERTSNTVLKAIEEPPPHSVLLLCAPSVEDLLPTIRSRCRLASLRTPPAEAVASVLVGRDGVDPAMAAFAAQAAQGHIGRAKRLATDEQARRERATCCRCRAPCRASARR